MRVLVFLAAIGFAASLPVKSFESEAALTGHFGTLTVSIPATSVL